MKTYKLGSLFDGSGGFPLVGRLCGIEPAWASEIEPYPIAVTKNHFPNMKHLGDITKINGAEIEPVDIITFGSPCQDLSIGNGRRAGLKHKAHGEQETTRSGLFMEAIRIIKEMREATNGKYPTFAFWENVPGAFSSNKGEDFRIVLEELIKIAEPDAVMPSVPQKGWAYADYYRGDGFSLSYRVFDAQYWGVPQRRRRIHLILDLGGERAGEILFIRKGLPRYSAESFRSWQRTAGSAADRTGTASLCLTVYENHSQDTRYTGPIDTAPTVSATYGMGGNNQPFVVSVKELQPTLVAKDSGAIQSEYTIRRLTPIECARLQGFPDLWGDIDPKTDFTDAEYQFWLDVRNTAAGINGRQAKVYTKEQMVKWYNKLHTDSAEYEMWGNGIALPPALYCMQGIADVLNENAEEEEYESI